MKNSNAIGSQASGLTNPFCIAVNQHFWGAFDNRESEVSARWIVMYCQHIGRWTSFTFDDINRFYQRVGRKSGEFNFGALVNPIYDFGGGWITFKDGIYQITDEFIERCFKSSPVDEYTGYCLMKLHQIRQSGKSGASTREWRYVRQRARSTKSRNQNT